MYLRDYLDKRESCFLPQGQNFRLSKNLMVKLYLLIDFIVKKVYLLCLGDLINN